MWGIVPAAGLGSRIQPLAFSKELLPVGSRLTESGERPKAVSEYIVERMLLGGADKICFVISPGKSDIVKYFGSDIGGAQICYVVQPAAAGLCDAIFRALPLVRADEPVLVGLPDTVWFPAHGYQLLPAAGLSFLCFPVDRPELFDAVSSDAEGSVQEIQVKQANAASRWVWGAFKLDGATLHALHTLWCEREPRDPYIGTLVNEYLRRGGAASALKAGAHYYDVGTIDGYRRAVQSLGEMPAQPDRNATCTPLFPANVGG